ncbi:MAG: hypothetical protein GY895_04440 [Phycisphaera sp.]|nr:hypothetical protein [Phycisphaera sp.]
MRCLTCEYPLWDLRPGNCPECGESFDPTGHRFKNGSVAFCCPHCDQTYFGEGEDGHLVPQQFDCVSCGQRISESECIVRPREDGSHEDMVTTVDSPWHDRNRRLRSRFYGTLGLSLFGPGRLGAGFPVNMPPFGAFGFVSLILVAIFVVGVLPVVLLVGLAGSGRGMPAGSLPSLIGTMATSFAVTIPMVFILLSVYGAIVHGILRVGGRTTGGIMRTIGSLGFGSGPLVFLGIPIFGPYCLHVPMLIWMMISSTLVLRAAQGVSGWRAALAVILPMLLFTAVIVSGVMFSVAAAAQTVQNALATGPVKSFVYRPDTEAITFQPAEILEQGNWSNGPPLPVDVERIISSGESSATSDDELGLFDSEVVRSIAVPGFDGWWIPGLLVVEGPAGRVVAVVDWSKRRNSFNGVVHVFDAGSRGFGVPLLSNDEVTAALGGFLGGPSDQLDFPVAIIDEWLSASGEKNFQRSVSFP